MEWRFAPPLYSPFEGMLDASLDIFAASYTTGW